jgi:hypothetical protein
MHTAEERIAETFDTYFANFGIRIDPGEVRIGGRGQIRSGGWYIRYRVVPDDAGGPSLEFYATHRMTNDRHAVIWADGHLDKLEAIREFSVYNPDVPGAKEAAEQDYRRHNRLVADRLRAAGLFPDGDINAYLRTGGGQQDDQGSDEGSDDR